jgi:hypothetical protein
MEIGSFIEMQFEKGREYYNDFNIPSDFQLVRLNSGRAAIYHAIRCLNCNTIYLPYYQCESVRDFLLGKGLTIRYYYIANDFTPLLEETSISKNSAVIIVNYYGIFSYGKVEELATRYTNVIVDNSQAFFCKPVVTNGNNSISVYSCRKFIGVPDGAYVIGKNVKQYTSEYEQDYSSDTSLFLLQRVEYGCEGKAYQNRVANEHRIATSNIKNMSRLTYSILDGTDYNYIIEKRKHNFDYAQSLFFHVNKLNPLTYYSTDCVPMVYPLLIEDDNLLDQLLKAKHFQGHWWSYLCDELMSDCFEYWLSRYMLPITIDQRYNESDIMDIGEVLLGNFAHKMVKG